MNISERQAKIPSKQRTSVSYAVIAVFLVVYFDFFGIATAFKWILYFLIIIGVLVGGYFVYLRTRQDD